MKKIILSIVLAFTLILGIKSLNVKAAIFYVEHDLPWSYSLSNLYAPSTPEAPTDYIEGIFEGTTKILFLDPIKLNNFKLSSSNNEELFLDIALYDYPDVFFKNMRLSFSDWLYLIGDMYYRITFTYTDLTTAYKKILNTSDKKALAIPSPDIWLSVDNPNSAKEITEIEVYFYCDLMGIETLGYPFDNVEFVGYSDNHYLNIQFKSDVADVMYDYGYSEGFIEGKTQGYDSGVLQGYDNGYNKGVADSYNNGYQDGINATYQDAYDLGYFKGGEESFLGNFDTWIVPAIISVLIVAGFFAIKNMKGRNNE
jgi:hypothetical protein